MRPDERLARIAERQFGIFTLEKALRCGLTPDQAAYRLRIGRWKLLHRGVYVLAGAPLRREGRVLAATLAAGADAWASHGTAASLFGFAPGDDLVDVIVPGRRRLEVAGVRVHRPRAFPTSDRTRLGPIPVTTPGRAIVDLAGALDHESLEAALDEALRRDFVRVKVLLRRCEEQRFAGNRVLRTLLVERLDGYTESPLELRFLRLIRAARLPAPKPQFEIRSSGRLVGRVDFAFVAPRVAVELDGYAYHNGKRRFDADHNRDQGLIDAGWFPLHFTDLQVRQRPDAVVATVRRTIQRRLRGG